MLSANHPRFALLETMLWQPSEGFFLLDYHLERLQQSAEYFNYPVDLEQVRQGLHGRVSEFGADPQRVRLLLNWQGQLDCQATPLAKAPAAEAPRLKLTTTAVNSQDVFLYHKTTNRRVYETRWALSGHGITADAPPSPQVGGGYVVTTLAGTPGKSGAQDGPSAQALFNSPHAALWGEDGALYVNAGDTESRWAKHIAADPRVRLRLDGALYELRADRVTDARTIAAFGKAWTSQSVFRRDPARLEQVWLFRMVPR